MSAASGKVKLGPRIATELGPFTPSQRTCCDNTAMTVSCQLRKFPFYRREVKTASRGLNKNIPAILNRIERAHTLTEGRSWHPHPASARRIDVKDKERVGFSVVCAKRRRLSGVL